MLNTTMKLNITDCRIQPCSTLIVKGLTNGVFEGKIEVVGIDKLVTFGVVERVQSAHGNVLATNSVPTTAEDVNWHES